MTIPIPIPRKLLVVATVAMCAMFLVVAWVARVWAEGGDGEYHACLNRSSGTILVVGADEACRQNEHRVELYDAQEVDARLSALEIQMQAALDAEIAAREAAEAEFLARLGAAEVSIAALDTQMSGVHRTLGEWANLPTPIPGPEWFEGVNSMLDWYANLPIPVPGPQWFEDVNSMLDWYVVLPVPVPGPEWFEDVNSMLDWYANLPIPLPGPEWYEDVNSMLNWYSALPEPIPGPD